MDDEELIRVLRSIDHTSVDDCFLQSPYYTKAADRIEALIAERDEFQQVFDMQWKADMRAVEMWREAHPGNDLVLPDSAKLSVWLLDRVEGE
jgi:hypothetical protein